MSTTAATAAASAGLLQRRVVSAIRGAFVADAASMGTHWIYNPAEMQKAVPSLDAPEFKNPPTPSFYSAEEFPGHYGPGALSPYGEQLLFVTEYVAKHGAISGGEALSHGMLEWANTFGGRQDHALKAFVENMNKEDGSGKWPNCGADDDQAHIYMKIIPVTCLYAGKPERKEKVTDAIRVHQNNATAVAFGLAASQILESVLLGASLDDALNSTLETFTFDNATEQAKVIESLSRGKAVATEYKTLEEFLLQLSHEKMKDQPDSPFYDFAARSCQLPGSFIGPIYQFYKTINNNNYKEAGTLLTSEAYVQAVRENILGSGDTCSRAQFVGAVLAAAAADETPPQDWLDQLDRDTFAKVEAAAQAIAEKATVTPE